jgi:hypothetical protein|tara:strand:+ start:666 stop:896 length:231 start_codon:yes stop_codon:yes gene_type:complete
MAEKKDKVDTSKRGYRDELRKRAIKKAMPKKKKKEEKAASPRTEAAQESKVTLQNIVDGINRINKYFDGAAQEVLS